MSNLKQINSKDNVAVSLDSNSNIKLGHKIALCDINKGEYVFKYGNIIGRAKENIKKGDWVHTHNLETNLDKNTNYKYTPNFAKYPGKHGYFMGFKRKNGRAGIRNDIYIIPTVGCVNSVVKAIEEKCKILQKGSVDSIAAFTHQFGCSQLGDDQKNIANLLASLALNPNASFILFVGLGCENNSIKGIQKILEPYQRDNIEFMNAQDYDDDVEHGFEIVKAMVEKAKNYKREKISIEELCIGLKCGGSDGLSGITANPTVGRVTDEIISMGGSAILTEVPEMFGAEQILMNMCENQEIFEKYCLLIDSFKKYYTDLGFPIYENPSPGNKEGGITTLEEKSLGCITKAGTTKIVDILKYGEPCKNSGLSILNGPGNDLIASTALAASGCQLILFTTGRGTPFSTVVPTIKIATNNELAKRKNNWIDFNAFPMDDKQLLEMVLKTASGEYKTKQEDSHEIAFFKKGVTL